MSNERKHTVLVRPRRQGKTLEAMSLLNDRITDLERRNGELEKALTDLVHGCEVSFDWQYDPEFTKEFNAAFEALARTKEQK